MTQIGDNNQCKSIIIQCDQCSFNHRNQLVMNVHALVHSTQSIRFGCPYCCFDNIWKDSVRSHINIKHNRLKNMKWCPYCNYKSSQKIEIDSHIEKHHKNVPRLCSFCEFSTIDRLQMVEHINSKHKEEDIYKCCDCPYKTTYLKCLNLHFKNKHNSEVFHCKFASIHH
ncbi:hypothetical protein WA026_011175 [Henosepilachna vigintioctopunctata]|uniref:C2H2-type domain-containing protein n=1 Tax=Henosepilachna vigintioctopunctata TaxID=420089 RepID=A0AAW1U650_9CUCU